MIFYKIFGTLSLDTGVSYYVYLKQTSRTATWVLLDIETEEIVAVLATSKISNTAHGYGEVVILNRMLELYTQAIANAVRTQLTLSEGKQNGALTRFIYEDDGVTFLKADYGSEGISSIVMNYEGFSLAMVEHTNKFPKLPKLLPILNRQSSAAIIANLGVKTAQEAKMKFNLEWYKRKRYYTVKTNEQFLDMMDAYCKCVQEHENRGEKLLTGVDTETTGLFTVTLSKDNPAKDWIVAIPFAWEDDAAYLIHVRMEYFENVSFELISKYFNLLFSRNADFTGQDIEVHVRNNIYRFNRNSIETTGHNTMFDGQTFYSEDIDFFFDEDSLQLIFNLATDWSKGKSSLKAITRRMFGDETLELEDLFGSKHKDKFAFLQDEELARIYGCADADYSRLIQKKLKDMTEPNLYYQYKKYDMCLMHLYAIAAANGMPIDTANVKRLGEQVKQDIETIQHFVYRYAYKAIHSRTNLKVMDILRTHFSDTNAADMGELMNMAEAFDEDEEYCFKFTPTELKNLLYGILKYPVKEITEADGQPALNKQALKRLMSYKMDTPVDALKEDILSCFDTGTGKREVLISAKEFNTDRYPLARVLSKYAELNKEYTAYYAPIVDTNLEGRMFKSFSTTKAATRRIINPLQTVKGALKKYYIAPKGKIFCSFDVSQMEYRLMASIAYISLKKRLQEQYPSNWEVRLKKSSIAKIKAKMTHPETDYHIETASTLHNIKPHLVTKKLRKSTKTIGFGIPYGLGTTSLCEQLYGDVTKENMVKTKELLNLFQEKQADIIHTLNEARAQAFIPHEIPVDFREFMGIDDTNVSIVRNFAGFYRLFILQNLTKKATASIRRKAGNFGIQGGAAELFRRMQYRFYLACVEAGIQHKIQWLVNVHDELDFLVDDDIDIILLIELLYKSCTLVYKDHIPYYIGINFGENWADAKDDAAELPVIMVQRLIKRYHEEGFRIPCDGQQPEALLRLKHEYLADRIYEELCKSYPMFSQNYQIDLTQFDDVFVNYTVRSYIFEFLPKELKIPDASLSLYLTMWAKERIPKHFDKFVMRISENEYVRAADIYDAVMTPGTTELDLGTITLPDDFEFESLDVEEDSDGYFGEEAFISVQDDENQQGAFAVDYTYDSNDQDDEYIEDLTATNAYDLIKLKHYARKYLNTLGSDTYSVILSSTRFAKDPTDLIKYIQRMPKGDATIYVVWRKMLTFKNVSSEQEELDNLDKFIGGVKA